MFAVLVEEEVVTCHYAEVMDGVPGAVALVYMVAEVKVVGAVVVEYVADVGIEMVVEGMVVEEEH